MYSLKATITHLVNQNYIFMKSYVFRVNVYSTRYWRQQQKHSVTSKNFTTLVVGVVIITPRYEIILVSVECVRKNMECTCKSPDPLNFFFILKGFGTENTPTLDEN